MDVATHALTGWTIARAGMDRLSPHASWIALLGAVAPDTDLALRVLRPADYLLWHRGPTHSWALAPPIAAICVAIVALVFRTRLPWLKGWLVAMAGVTSHLLLDAVNPAGAQWLWPVSHDWIGIDLTRRGDPWIAVILLVLAAAPALSRLVSGEIGARSTKGRGAAIFALLLVCAYLGVRYQYHLRALAMLESRLYDRHAPIRSTALPERLNPFDWTGIVDTGSFLVAVPVATLGQFNPDAGTTFYPPENRAAAEAVTNSPLYSLLKPRLAWVTKEAIPEEDGVRVTVRELRLGWVYEALVDKSGRVSDEKFRVEYLK